MLTSRRISVGWDADQPRVCSSQRQSWLLPQFPSTVPEDQQSTVHSFRQSFCAHVSAYSHNEPGPRTVQRLLSHPTGSYVILDGNGRPQAIDP
ncbi:hypothetical protein N656DRAFT_775740 [Canariomyces notabilis]|uniref:Uncharacterized protein n=1 Tax=Canariomyces notabilis TaxID=2074819 RepID=A0AAN6YW70_9PEZI|nr:hypothetical protein N656DRAFT_775740 [Canariomyces arenarius]